MATPSAPDLKDVDFHTLAQNLSKVIEQSQRVLQEYLKRQQQGDQLPLIDPTIVSQSFQELFQQLLKNPDRLLQAPGSYVKMRYDLSAKGG